MKKKLLIFVSSLAMVLAMTPLQNLKAAENQELDIVMVLDQSGSMETNDPNGLMKEAANMLVEMMPAKSSRAGVISFNRQQTEVAGLTEVSDEENVKEITEKVDSIEYTGGTNIGDAVANAAAMFNKDDGRIHAILVLSDGQNDFGWDKNAEQKSDERLYDALAEAKNSNYQIYCLGFGEEMADTSAVPYQKLADIATDTDKISSVTDPAHIHDFFVKMLSDLTGGIPNQVTNGEIKIEPNVKEANIYLSSPEDFSNVEIQLLDVDGNAVSLENSDSMRFYRSNYAAVIKMFGPKPGTYKITVSQENVDISVGYLPAYEYVLSSSILDQDGNEITQIENQGSAQIRAVIRQDGQDITDSEAYAGVSAEAVITARDTGESQTVPLTWQDEGYLQGEASFGHVAVYTVDVHVGSDSFSLDNTMEIQANKRGIALKGEIEKKELDKTFKESAELLVKNKELTGIVEDPDNVGVEITQVASSDQDKVRVEKTEKGLVLTGLKWGSAKVDVAFEDGLGNTVETAFTVKVADHFLTAFFTALPVLVIMVAVLSIYLLMRQSRMIKGEFEVNRVTIRKGEDHISVINVRKSYRPKTFISRKKTLGCGMARYSQDVFSADNSLPQNKELYRMFANNQSEMKRNLDEVKFTGTYLGLRGCILKIKKGAPVSINNNRNYGKAVKLAWRVKSSFKVYAKDAAGAEICVEGTYINSTRSSRSAKKAGTVRRDTGGGKSQAKANNDFEDDFFD